MSESRLSAARSIISLRAAFLSELTECDHEDPALLNAMSQYFSETVPTGEFTAYLAVVDGRAAATSRLIIHRHRPVCTREYTLLEL
jgi:hypothetical protein